MKKIINFIKKHEKILFLSILTIFCIVFFSSYFFTTFPYSQGWGEFYADLVFDGKIPYKDFYYYLPPYNLILDCIFWKLSFGHFIIYCLFRFAERIVMIWLIYLLLCKIFKPRFACIGTCVGTAMFGATVFDIIGDYNQTSLLLSIVLTIIYFKYVENLNSSLKKQYKYLFIAGIVIGLSFTLKQPLFVAESLIFFTLITLVFILNKKKNYIKSLGISILGIIIPIALISIILILNNAFIPFINQVYLGASGKGGISNILLVLIKACLKYKFILLSSSIILCMLLNNKNIKDKKYITLSSILLVMITFGAFFESKVETIDKIVNTTFGLANLCILAILIIIDKFSSKKHDNSILMSIIYVGIFLLNIFVLIFKTSISTYIFNNTEAFALLNDLCVLSILGTIFMIFYYLYNYNKNKDLNLLKMVFVLAGGLVYEYAMAMGATDTAHNAGSIIIISIVITMLLEKFYNKNIFIKYLTITVSLFIIVGVTSQKITNAYAWWGWSESVTDSKKSYSINVPGLEGFKTTKDKKEMYEEMYKVLKENSNDKSVIYGFPYIKIFNVLLKNTNMNTFVPVPWYDVCSDEYAIKDAKKLKNNPPDIIIYNDIPNALEAHETIYRNGKQLGQRKIIEWLKNEIKNEKYILIGQYDNIYIYKLKNGEKINYKYIKDKDADNNILIKESDKNE